MTVRRKSYFLTFGTRVCVKSLETKVRKGENSPGSGVYWL